MARSGSVILIVEDELLIRMDSAEAIENAGFEVIQAGSADEAIVILTAGPDIHVVLPSNSDIARGRWHVSNVPNPDFADANCILCNGIVTP